MSKNAEKPGKVLRIDPLLHKYLKERKRKRDSWSAVLRRELGLRPRRGAREYAILFALESDLFRDRGDLLLAAARRRMKESDLSVKRVKEIK